MVAFVSDLDRAVEILAKLGLPTKLPPISRARAPPRQAVNEQMIEKSGSWFSFNGERIGQGREQSREYLKAHPEILVEVEKRLFGKAGLKVPPRASDGNGAAATAAETPIDEANDSGEEKKRGRGGK